MKAFKQISKINNWKIYELPDLLFFQEGPGVRNWQFTEKGVKLLNVKNINNGTINLDTTNIHISEEEAYGKYSHFLANAGDLVIASSGIVVDNFHNKIAFIRDEHLPLCMNTSTIRFKVKKKELIDIHYFRLFLGTDNFKSQLRRLITGSAQLNFGPSHLKKIKIPLPSLDDQKHIAHLLGKVEGLIARRKQHLQQLDDILKSVFLEMFGDYIKDKQETDLASYITTLTDYHANGSYETLRKNVELLTEPNFALMVRTTDLEKNNFSEGCNYITENAYNFLEKSKVFGGEIIVNKIGSAGKVYLMPHLNRPVSLGMNAFLIRFNKDLNSVFAYYFLTSDIGTQRIHNLVQGAVTKTITKNAIRSIRIPIVHINLQNQFAAIVQKVEGLKSRYKQSLTNLEQLYGVLSQKAFNDDLDLSRVPLPTEGPEIAEDVKLEAEEKQPNKKRAGTINA